MQNLEVIPTYIAVKPTPSSKLRLARLYTELREEGFEIADFDYLHVTVFMSGVAVNERQQKLSRRPGDHFDAKIVEVKQLGDWTVFVLESEDLVARHNEWRRQGLVSKYPEFIPHLSVAKAEMTPEFKQRLSSFEGTEIRLYRETIKIGYKD